MRVFIGVALHSGGCGCYGDVLGFLAEKDLRY